MTIIIMSVGHRWVMESLGGSEEGYSVIAECNKCCIPKNCIHL